jgi:CRISPR type III-A-associated protein Csm2
MEKMDRSRNSSGSKPQHTSSEEKNPQPVEIQAALKDMPLMIRDGDAQKIVAHCKAIAPLLSQVSTSQIRNVFGPVKRMELEWTKNAPDDKARAVFRQLVLLRSKLEYMVARASKDSKAHMENFQTLLDKAIEQVEAGSDFQTRRAYFENFVAFFESLVAFHKRYEKRSS